MILKPVLPLVTMLALGACVLGHGAAKTPSGADDFADFCSSCHGVSGKGDGALATSLPHRPADLTGLAKRAGGTFPTTKVMAKIWGYTGGKSGAAVMPAFAPLLDSDLIPYDGGDGIMSPTPMRLIQIAEYLKTLQAK